MPRSPEAPLLDILEAIHDLENFVDGKTLGSFQEDRLLQAAVERKFEIIGEALNRIKLIDPALLESITGSKSIIGMRNIIAHGYDVIDPDILWDAIESHLSKLKKDVSGLREHFGESE